MLWFVISEWNVIYYFLFIYIVVMNMCKVYNFWGSVNYQWIWNIGKNWGDLKGGFDIGKGRKGEREF